MSEFEDRQDATPAIDAPARVAQTQPARRKTAKHTAAADATADAADNDSEAIAVVEGVVATPETPDEDADLRAFEGVVAHSDMREVAGESDAGIDDLPLLDGSLEDGIASVFAALHAAARDGELGESDEPAGPLSDVEAADGITFRLLGELDRLWHRAA